MNLRHISDFLPKPPQYTVKPEPKRLPVKEPATKQRLMMQIGQSYLALKTPNPKAALIEAKNLAKELLALIELLEIEACVN